MAETQEVAATTTTEQPAVQQTPPPDTTRDDAIAEINKAMGIGDLEETGTAGIDAPKAVVEPVETPETEEPKADEPAETPAPEFPADLLASARQLGITKSQARNMGEDAVRAMVERFIAPAKAGEEDGAGEEPEPAKPAPKSGKANDFAVDETLLDPETAATIKRLHDHYAPRLKDAEAVADKLAKLESKFAQVNQIIERQQAQAQFQQAVTRFDKTIDSLGEDWHDVLGKGPSSSLDRKSKEFANREALADLIGSMFPVGAQVDEAKYAKVLRGLAVGEFEEHANKISKRQQAARVSRAQSGKWQSGESNGVNAKDRDTPQPTSREEFARELARRTGIPTGIRRG